MNVLIIGAGAIGCLVGSKLAQGGATVTFAGRPAIAQTINRQGVRLLDERGAHTVRNVRAAGSIAAALALPGAACDVAVMTVKSYDTAQALDELAAALDAAGAAPPCLLCLQNGVGNEEAIAEVVGPQRVIAGTIATPVAVTGPAEISVARPRYQLGLSPWTAAEGPPLFAELAASLEQAGFAVKRYRSAQGMKWSKLLLNMIANASCAALDMPPAAVAADPRLLELEIAASREAVEVMAAAGIPALQVGVYPLYLFPWLLTRAPLALRRSVLRKLIAGGRGTKMPSLHIDLQSGKRQSEARWLNGAVVRQGAEVGVATPVNQALLKAVELLAGDAVAQAAWRRRPEALLKAAAALEAGADQRD